MTDIRALAIDFELKITGWSKRANGEIRISGIVHSDDAHKVGPIEPGRRFQVAAVELGDDEQPTQAGRSHGLDSQIRTTRESLDKPAPTEPARAPRNPYLARAHILCGDPEFQRYLREYKRAYCPDAQEAANHLRSICGVTSRKEIVTGSQAAMLLDLLESSFIAWRAQR